MRLASHNEYSWSAFWLLGADFRSVGWPFCGEVEITEMWVTKVSWDNAVGKAMVPRTSPFPVAVIALPPRLLPLAPCVIPHDSTAQVPCLTAHTSNAPPPVGGWDGWDELRWVVFNGGGYDTLVRDGKVDRRATTSTASRRSLTRSGGGSRDTRTHALICMISYHISNPRTTAGGLSTTSTTTTTSSAARLAHGCQGHR